MADNIAWEDLKKFPTLPDALREIERLRAAGDDLCDAFQQLTDHGDACPICFVGFKATRVAANCYGHAAVIELQARRG